MKCVIYKGRKKSDTYLYVERDGDFSRVPPALLAMLGALDRVMEIELSPQRALAQADVSVVMRWLSEQGYFLQMPPNQWQSPVRQQ
jgi:uncharacterized protein